MEKKLGLYKQYQQMTATEQAAVRKKRAAAGKQIHLNNMQEVEGKKEAQTAERYSELLQALIKKGVDEKDAEALLIKNIELCEQREERLHARNEKRKGAN